MPDWLYLFLSTGKVRTLGEVTPAMVCRAGNISGAIGHKLVQLYAKNIDGLTKEASQQKAVCDYMQTYGGDDLVQTIPDKKLSGAETFTIQWNLRVSVPVDISIRKC